jgi:hypothetical protein
MERSIGCGERSEHAEPAVGGAVLLQARVRGPCERRHGPDHRHAKIIVSDGAERRLLLHEEIRTTN